MESSELILSSAEGRNDSLITSITKKEEEEKKEEEREEEEETTALRPAQCKEGNRESKIEQARASKSN